MPHDPRWPRVRGLGILTGVAMNYPLYIISALLGLPEEDFPRMLKLTQEMFGKDDPDMAWLVRPRVIR